MGAIRYDEEIRKSWFDEPNQLSVLPDVLAGEAELLIDRLRGVIHIGIVDNDGDYMTVGVDVVEFLAAVAKIGPDA